MVDFDPCLTHGSAANCYRIVADPCVQQGSKSTIPGDGGPDTFGSGIALSADGKTALIAAPGAKGDLGAAWIYARNGSRWRQGAALVPSDELGAARVGVRVALSADGSTALVGGPWDDGGIGAAWVFVRSGSTWVQQAKLVPDDGTPGLFGAAVALSGDGTTALVGAQGDGSGVGAAWVFARAGTTWAQASKLTANDETGNGRFGIRVALAGDGRTALIGGWNDDHGVGAAWVFVRSAAGWAQQGPKLLARDESGEGSFGGATSLSADGNTALVGGEDDDGTVGAAWVFVRSGSMWTQDGPKLTARNELGAGAFGKSVALTADGGTALIGAGSDNGAVGAAWVFARTGSGWSQEVTKLTAAGEAGAGNFGKNLALSADGNTALIAGPLDDENVGAVWSFASRPVPAAAQ